MNRINFNQPGGFPLSTDVLNQMQVTYTLLNSLGMVAGDKSIISGCTSDGSNVSDGVVVINGEILEFKGGPVQTKVIIVEEVTQLVFGDENSKDAIYKRYAQFGTGTTFWLWSDFISVFPAREVSGALAGKASLGAVTTLQTKVEELEKKAAVFQSGGGMVLWNKPASQIPVGWQEVVDWRGRIPAGFDPADDDFKPMGKEAGSKTVALTAENNGPHTHDLKLNTNFTGDGYFAMERGNSEVLSNFVTESSGEGAPFSIMNPYRVVMFIEYVG